MKELLPIFVSIFIAEVGDKTQLATLLFATDSRVAKAGVFLAASAALVSATFLTVLVGGLLAKFAGESTLKIVAGIGFILIGVWTLASAYR